MMNAAVVFSDVNKVEMIDRQLEPLKAGEKLVKTKKSMISSGTELTILTREGLDNDCVWTSYGSYPYFPGYNNIGVVIDVADEEDRWLIGKKTKNLRRSNHDRWRYYVNPRGRESH